MVKRIVPLPAETVTGNPPPFKLPLTLLSSVLPLKLLSASVLILLADRARSTPLPFGSWRSIFPPELLILTNLSSFVIATSICPPLVDVSRLQDKSFNLILPPEVLVDRAPSILLALMLPPL